MFQLDSRRLPEELYEMIIVEVFHNSVHAVCTSTGDISWEFDALYTLSCVSKAFKAIATEVVCKALIPPEEIKKNPESSFFPEFKKVMTYLRNLGTRLRHPSNWEDLGTAAFDSPAPFLVVGYALFVSSVSLRRNSMRSPLGIFVSTYHVTHSALTQSLSLCEYITPREMARLLSRDIQEELELAQSTHDIVQITQSLAEYTTLLKQEPTDSTSLEDDAIIKGKDILTKLNEAEQRHRQLTSNRPLDPSAHEILNVKQVLWEFQLALVPKSHSSLHEQFDELINQWSIYCPFLSQRSCSCTTSV